jgi:hypothetical protein
MLPSGGAITSEKHARDWQQVAQVIGSMSRCMHDLQFDAIALHQLAVRQHPIERHLGIGRTVSPTFSASDERAGRLAQCDGSGRVITVRVRQHDPANASAARGDYRSDVRRIGRTGIDHDQIPLTH